jgi:hypothetical protein
MEKEYRILTECYIDFMLMEAIMRLSPNDQHSGINEIGNKLEKNYSNRKAVVLIDDDKVKAKFMNQYVIQNDNKQLKIKFTKHKKNSHYAVQISPASETWILEVCQKSGIDVTKSPYRLPKDPKKLASITKSIHAFRDTRLQQLMNTMHQKNPLHFRVIRSWINEIL